MDIENGKKTDVGFRLLSPPKARLAGALPVMLRLATLAATVIAALVMGLNKQTKTTAVAIVGTTPIFQNLTAEFRQTPAFVYFVIANAIAGAYNLLVLSAVPFLKCRAFAIVVHLTDMMVMTLVVTGAAAAASIAELGRNGNLHARWSPICDRFESFCHHGGAALLASFAGALLLMVLNGLSTVSLYKNAVRQG